MTSLLSSGVAAGSWPAGCGGGGRPRAGTARVRAVRRTAWLGADKRASPPLSLLFSRPTGAAEDGWVGHLRGVVQIPCLLALPGASVAALGAGLRGVPSSVPAFPG